MKNKIKLSALIATMMLCLTSTIASASMADMVSVIREQKHQMETLREGANIKLYNCSTDSVIKDWEKSTDLLGSITGHIDSMSILFKEGEESDILDGIIEEMIYSTTEMMSSTRDAEIWFNKNCDS